MADATRPAVSIADVFKALTGRPLNSAQVTGEVRDVCLSPEHGDRNASCDYNLTKNQWHCKPCNKGGGYVKLVAWAKPEFNANGDAQKWLKEQGLLSSVQQEWAKVAVTYDYVDEDGTLLLQVGRWNSPKAFGQRVPDGKGGWKYSLKDLKRKVPFKLPELMKAVARGETIYVVEGEKDVLALEALGLCATTNPQGAKWKWPVEWAAFFDGAAKVVVIADNDNAGRDGSKHRAGIVARVCENTYMVEAMPDVTEKGDVSDWLKLNEGAQAADFERTVDERCVKVEPYKLRYPDYAAKNLAKYQDDTGNGYFFAQCFPEQYAYITTYAKWYGYENGVWLEDVNMMEASRKAVELMRDAAQDAGLFEDLEDHITSSRDVHNRKRMLEAAQDHLGKRSSVLETHPTILNLTNGTLYLDAELKAVELMPHDAEQFLTLQLPYDYDKDADCPNFKKWLMEACSGSQPLFDYMQQVMGSCLIGTVGHRVFYVLIGPKGTGKSTFNRMLLKLLGPYGIGVDPKTFESAKYGSDASAPSPALAQLKGKRMVTASELADDKTFDTSLIKRLIGGGVINARRPYAKHAEEFYFQGTLIMDTNDLPKLRGDDALWPKLMPIPFQHQIVAEDKEYEKKYLDPELSGILNFALEGLKQLQANGYRLPEPEEVQKARDAERDTQDPFAEWFEECAELSKRDECPTDVLFNSYDAWCAKNKVYTFKKPKLTKWLEEKHGVTVRKSSSKQFYVGVRPKFEGSASTQNGEPGF